jgi:hypothetical protein
MEVKRVNGRQQPISAIPRKQHSTARAVFAIAVVALLVAGIVAVDCETRTIRIILGGASSSSLSQQQTL